MKKTVGITLTAMLVASGAMANIVFDFNNGTEFDTAANNGVGGAMSVTNGVDIRTITTVDIIGQDGTKASDGAGHTLNVNGSNWNALGIKNATADIYDTSSADYGNFNSGESWVFKFDADVKLNELDAGSMAGTDQWTLSGTGFSDIVYDAGDASGDTADLGGVFVAAGTEITLATTSALEIGHNFRFSYLDVTAVPEPGTLGLMGACAVGVFMIRRFRM